MSAIAFWLFWSGAALVVYTYLLFPLVHLVRGRLALRPHAVGSATPQVSLIICAHNEASGIGAKLENVCRLDYPVERLEVIVASDGSSDGTDERVGAWSERVRLLRLPRRGKIPTLNAAVADARGEILVFSDANSLYAVDALRALVGPFADPEVGGVAGDQRYSSASAASEAGEGERAYWNLDRRLKQWQSAAGSVTSATGAIHAVRRELYRPVPSGVTDDFWISTNVVAQSRRLVFAGEAVAFEPPAASCEREFRRKVRVMTRGLRGVWLMRRLLNPLEYGFYSVQLFSHKVARRLLFLPLVALLVASPVLWGEGLLYQLAALGQGGVYGLAAAGALARRRAGPRVLALPFYFCMVNIACLLATWNVLRGRRIDSWEPDRELAVRPGDRLGGPVQAGGRRS